MAILETALILAAGGYHISVQSTDAKELREKLKIALSSEPQQGEEAYAIDDSVTERLDDLEDEYAELESERNRLKEKNRELNRRAQAADAAVADANRCLDAMAAGTEKGTPWCGGNLGRALLAYHSSKLETKNASLESEVKDLRARWVLSENITAQILAQAIGGFPWYKDDQVSFPGAIEADGACYEPDVVQSLAHGLAQKSRRFESEVAALRTAIETHRSQKADDRCIEDDDRLYETLGDGIKCDRRVGSKDAMLMNCERFIQQRCTAGGWKTYAELEAENDALRADVARLEAVLKQLGFARSKSPPAVSPDAEGAVIMGPGKYRTLGFDDAGDVDYLATIYAQRPNGEWIGEYDETLTCWNTDGSPCRLPPEWGSEHRIIAPWTEGAVQE